MPCSAAECVKPVPAGNPGWLMPLIDLILARSALGDLAPHSCVTRRIDLHVHPDRLSDAETVRGVARRCFATGAMLVSTAELRSPSGMVLGTATGNFVASDSFLPVPYEADPQHIEAGSLIDLLELRFDPDPHTGMLPAGPRTANPSGVVHGGVQAAALCAAIEHVARTGDRVQSDIVSVGVDFVRPLPATKTPLVFRVTPRRAGRRFVTVEASMLTAEGEIGTRVEATLYRRAR
ncbi:acyl-CoA thioesterase domain-containing protein [Nocardia sp. NPDC052278]|uniref:acyl-CoA thioesterase domain-containing protein n=1 Tax=unclassified Nocardia TaxID=2637762 RepID=UPI0036BD1952